VYDENDMMDGRPGRGERGRGDDMGLEDRKERGDRPHRASARSVEYRPLEVPVQEGNFHRALSMLKRKMANEGIYKELRKRRFHEKPCEERKRRGREADRRRKKALRISREHP
jgi:small subunit ribosomal protein S21